MGRIQSSIGLFKASWAVLRQDRELLLLPVISALAAGLTIALFALPVLATVDFDAVDAAGDSTVGAGPLTAGLLALAYLVLAFISIFFNAALAHAANERMDGGDPTVGSALRGAASRTNRILPWAIVSATVSFIISQIQRRGGVFGSILGFLGGMAWSAVTFLVLPILVIEDISVTEAVKRSTGLLRSAWGEGLAGHIGLGIISFLAMIPLAIVAAVGASSGAAAVAIPLVAIAIVGFVGVLIVTSALSIVFQTALYRFATSQPTASFERDLMQDAFRIR
jgi:hypothetical protein